MISQMLRTVFNPHTMTRISVSRTTVRTPEMAQPTPLSQEELKLQNELLQNHYALIRELEMTHLKGIRPMECI